MSKPKSADIYKDGENYSNEDTYNSAQKYRYIKFVPVTNYTNYYNNNPPWENNKKGDGHSYSIYVKHPQKPEIILTDLSFQKYSDDAYSIPYVEICGFDKSRNTQICFKQNGLKTSDFVLYTDYDPGQEYLANPSHTVANNIKRFVSMFSPFSGGRRSRCSRKTKRIRRRRTVRRVR